jgi:hypothetical protein
VFDRDIDRDFAMLRLQSLKQHQLQKEVLKSITVCPAYFLPDA